MKDYIFGGCTEILLQEIIESSSDIDMDSDTLIQQLSAFQKVCLDIGLCQKGEFVRSLMCRDFLRDAVQRMRKKLLSIDADAAIGSIVETTEQFIEAYGDETEAERAYVVVRNLIIVAENIVKQAKKQKLPIIAKQPVQLLCYHIDPDGVREFEEITGFKREKEIEKLLKLKLPPMTAKQECETRYRNLFFNLAVWLITIKETKVEANNK